MRKTLKFIKHNVLGFIVGAVIFGSLGVYAATVILGSNVVYDNASSKLTSTNVQDAIDELYAKTDNQYFDIATAKANTTGKVFASKKGVCISRNKTVYCFKINNWNIEKDHIKQVFSDANCDVGNDVGSSYVHCDTSDFNCGVRSNGDVRCNDSSDNSSCTVISDGSLYCY